MERAPLSEPAPPAPGPAATKKRRGGIGRVMRNTVATVMAVGLLAGLGAAAFVYHKYKVFSADLPSVEGLRDYQPRVMSRVYAADSRLISELATERRIFVPVGAIPELVKHAFLAAEDQKFWSHRGVDPFAIARAGITDVLQYGSGKRPVGASTITQQVAKNMLLGNEMSVARKVRELILALRIDESMSKERVLELYLNEIYLGLQAHGVAAAGQAYFNKGLEDLTIGEAAFLAALPKAPNNYNPFTKMEAAKARRDWVLDRMAETRAITPQQAADAKAEPIHPAPFRRPETVPGAEWFAEEVRRQMVENFGADATTSGGFSVRTSLDPTLQTAADAALRRGLLAYDRAHGGWRGPVGHVEGGAVLRANWNSVLAAQSRVNGIPPEWRLAIVTELDGNEAKVGWLERSVLAVTGGTKTGAVLAGDLSWARPIRPAAGPGIAPTYGPVPRRVADVLAVGDLVMIEPAPAAAPTRGPARTDRVLLRQIPSVQGALVAMDPATGRVVAMSGGWSFETSQFNRAVQAERQPGSSFKPFVYLTALRAGFSPSQKVLDAPFTLQVGKERWQPNNYAMTFSGPTPMRIALEKSLNLVTIRLAERVGMDAVAETAMGFHVVDGMPRVLPASLGAVETTVLRQAAAYAGLASGGREVIPSLVDSVQDQTGRVIRRAAPLGCKECGNPDKLPVLTDGRKQVVDPQSTFQVVTMMQGVVSRGTGYAAGQGLGRPVAGKTGTSQDFNDAWFVGFTPELVTAVWVGFDNNTSLGEKETGGAISAPIFRDFMQAALKGKPALQFRMPDGLKLAAWDSGSGRVTDAFKTDQEPGATQGVIGVAESTGLSISSSSTGVGVDSGVGGLY